jgi:hypothetical protein
LFNLKQGSGERQDIFNHKGKEEKGKEGFLKKRIRFLRLRGWIFLTTKANKAKKEREGKRGF